MCCEKLTFQKHFLRHLKLLHVFRNVTEQGLTELVVLPESDSYDSALCCLAADIDFDGQSEVLIGTYGQVIKCVKCHMSSRRLHFTADVIIPVKIQVDCSKGFRGNGHQNLVYPIDVDCRPNNIVMHYCATL